MKPSDSSEFDTSLLKDVRTSRDFKLCHPELVNRFKELKIQYCRENPGRDLLVTCTYRSPDEQRRLYMIGRNGNPGKIVTNADGKQKKSNHNHFPARALDVCVTEGGKPLWNEEAYWPLLGLAKKHGLVSGGGWSSFQDWPHLELPKEVA